MSVILNGKKYAGNLSDYLTASNKPKINSVEVKEDKTSYDLSILWTGTQEEYDAIGVKNPNTIYCINDDSGESPGADYYTKSEVDGLLTNMQTTTNKTTTWNETPTNNKYPTEKLVKETFDSLKQQFYDMVHPINEEVFGFSAPVVPDGITATWEDVSATYNGRALWISSASSAKTEVVGSLPNIEGSAEFEVYTGGTRPVVNLSGVSGACYSGGSTSSNVYATNITTATAYQQTKLGIKASKSNSVYGASAGTNVVRPTSVVIKVFKRTA